MELSTEDKVDIAGALGWMWLSIVRPGSELVIEDMAGSVDIRDRLADLLVRFANDPSVADRIDCKQALTQ